MSGVVAATQPHDGAGQRRAGDGQAGLLPGRRGPVQHRARRHIPSVSEFTVLKGAGDILLMIEPARRVKMAVTSKDWGRPRLLAALTLTAALMVTPLSAQAQVVSGPAVAVGQTGAMVVSSSSAPVIAVSGPGAGAVASHSETVVAHSASSTAAVSGGGIVCLPESGCVPVP